VSGLADEVGRLPLDLTEEEDEELLEQELGHLVCEDEEDEDGDGPL